jgi:arylsulfatase A-like enzyme
VIEFLRKCANGIVGGALGGALVGMAESVLVTLTSGAAEEYWLFLFGLVSYGLLGAAIGLGAAVFWSVVRRGAPGAEVTRVAAALAVAVPALAVGRYHVSQRIFSEGLQLLSGVGLLTHGLLLVGAVAVALVAMGVVRLSQRAAGGAGPALVTAILAAAALAVGLATGESATSIVRSPKAGAAKGKPNVILIVADTLRADAAHDRAKASRSESGIAALAADGVLFERAYSQSSWTRPSIASILTSQYPSVHGAMHKMDFLPERALTLAESFGAEGYWTAAFTTNINIAPVFNFQQGFDEFAYLEPSFYFGATDSATKLAIYKGLRVARERFFSRRMYFQHYYQDAEVVGAHVKEWLDSSPPEPFFLFIHYMDPHDPYFEIPYNGRGVARVMDPSPDASRVAELRDLYLQDVRYLDDHLRTLFDEWRGRGIYDRSVIAFTADHGEEFYEHQGWWHGTTLYEEAVHVPLLIKRATDPSAASRRKEPARTIDIAPTLMAAAGLSAPSDFAGVDLFEESVSEPLFAEEDLEGNRLTSIRSGEWKLITANPGNPRGLATTELFNLEKDPGETQNLAASERDRVSDLLAQLESLRARIAEHGRRLIGQRETDAADPRA